MTMKKQNRKSILLTRLGPRTRKVLCFLLIQFKSHIQRFGVFFLFHTIEILIMILPNYYENIFTLPVIIDGKYLICFY